MICSPLLRPSVTTMSVPCSAPVVIRRNSTLLGGIDHQYVAAGLVELHGRLRNHQRCPGCAAFDNDADKPARHERPVRIRQLRAHRDRIGGVAYLDIEKVGQSRQGINAAVGQPDVNHHMVVAVGRGRQPTLVVENVTLARLKDYINRVLADDRSEAPGCRPDKIALGEIGEADAAVNRGVDFRIGEIDFGLVERRLRNHHFGLRHAFVGRALVDGRLRNVLGADKLPATLQLKRGIHLGCFCFGQIGGLLLDRCLVCRLFNAKQKVAGFHLLPFGEIALLDEIPAPAQRHQLC